VERRTLPVLILLAIASAVLMAPSHPCAQTLEDKVKTFTLDNGMQFIVVERPVAPVLFGAVAFNVGSINEWDGQTGISHILEHMLFKGTRKIGTLSYTKEKRYLDREDALAMAIADIRHEIGYWRVTIYDDFARNLASSLPEEERQKIGSDKLKEMTAVIDILESRRQLPKEAERYLRAAVKADPQMAQAAYNLCVLTSKDRIGEAVTWCRKAAELIPQNPTYAYTLAFYLNQKGDREGAIKTLEALLGRHPGYRDAEMLLGDLLKREKKP